MEEHTGRDANEDGTERARDAAWFSTLLADLDTTDPFFLALLADEASIPALEPAYEKFCALFCETCRSGGRCRARARARDRQHEYEIEAERAQITQSEHEIEAARAQVAQSEHELETTRARVAEHKRLALETLTALHDDWQTFSRAEQDRKEAEYTERFRTLLVILEEDPDRWLPLPLMPKAPGRGRPPDIHTGIKVSDEADYRERIKKKLYASAKGSGITNLKHKYGGKSGAARKLGLSLATIRHKNKRYGITWDDILNWRV